MWVCWSCMTANGNGNNQCSECCVPKNSTEHLVVENNESNADDQLPLSIGDVVTVYIKEGENWRGKVGKQDGWFPKTCVDDKIIKREKYRVIKSVNNENTGHLKVDEGNEVKLLNKKSNGDVWVVFGGKGGWLPETYIEKVTSDKALPQIAPKPIKQPQESGKESKQGTPQRSNHLKKYNVLYDYANDDIEIEGGDMVVIVGVKKEGWLIAQIGEDTGFIPAEYVHILENQDDDIRFVVALYSGDEFEDLALQLGDVVKVVNRRKSGWVWVVKNQTEGWYPENHLQQIDNSLETDETTSEQPPTPVCSPDISTSQMRCEQGDLPPNMFGNTTCKSDEPPTKPPIVPKRQKVANTSTRIDTKDLTTNMYGNTDGYVGITEDISEPSNRVFGQKSVNIGIGDFIKRQSSVQTVEGSSDEPTTKPPVLPKREKIAQASTQIKSKDLTTNTYGNTDYHVDEPTTKPSILPKQEKIAKALTQIESKDIPTNTYGNPDYHDDEPITKPPILPKREKIARASTQIESKDLTTNTYGNTDYHVDEPATCSTKPPILPRRQKVAQTSQVHNRDLTTNTYGNTDYHVDEPTTMPPILPQRQQIAQASKQIEHKYLKPSTYGNTDYHAYGEKNESLEVKEYEEPTPTSRSNDTDEEKLDIYDYIQDKYVTYTKPAESRSTEPSYKPALPKRPPPPSRPPQPQLEEKTQIRTDEDIQQMASLYGRRDEKEIRFVMVGRTGSGKSATGNTIMAKTDHFESKLAGGSITHECKRGESSQAGRKIVVIDTPGLFDTNVPHAKISKEIIRCVSMSTPGPHAFLLVIQITRFTNEEIETFNRLFDLFGEGMGKFAIITFTKLDDLESEQTTIEEYIASAPKELKDFIKRCQGRYIAINNKATAEKKTAIVKNLIELADSIRNQNGGKYYTNGMYIEAEAAFQRKIKVLEEEKRLEKKKEIERIQSTFVGKIDSINQENKKLAKQLSRNENFQRQVQRDKEKANQEIKRMKDEMRKIDKKRNEESYRAKKQEKEEKEKQAKVLEESEKRSMQIIQTMNQQQTDMNRRYQEMERQKELQLSKASEDHNKKMQTEIQQMVNGSNQKFNEVLKALDIKEKHNEKLQEQIAKQNTSMQELMRDRDKEIIKQQDENNKRLAEEKDRANEYLRNQLEEQKKSMDATKEAILQEQRERDKKQREEYNAATAKAHEKLQEQLEKQNAAMQKLVLERDKEILKQQEEHNKKLAEEKNRADNTLKLHLDEQKKSMDVKTEAILQEREREKIKRQQDQDALVKINEKILQQNTALQELMRDSEKNKSKLEDQYKQQLKDEKDRARESIRKQQEEQTRYMELKTAEFLRQQGRERQTWEEIQELKQQKEKLEEEINKSGCVLS